MQRKKQEELAFLERENTLMATAWYDQASRLQMNSFVLQRMGDAPSSWLNKQRMAIHSSKVCLCNPSIPTFIPIFCVLLMVNM